METQNLKPTTLAEANRKKTAEDFSASSVESEADIYNRSQLKLSGYQKKKKTRV
jgi:hypothetical protein